MKKLIQLFTFLFLAGPFVCFGQSDGDYRSLKHGGGWASSGTFEYYTLATDNWLSAATAPTATTNVTILDGVGQTSNGNGYVAASLTIGQGNAFIGEAILTADSVTWVKIINPGKLMANPGVTFIGPGTTQATGSLTFKAAGSYYRDKGTGYTTATVKIGTAWAPGSAYVTGNQRSNGGNLYTCVTAGTSDVSGGPTGTGKDIVDGTAVWNYSGIEATAHAVISEGKIVDIIIDTPGSGYVASGASLPGISISGDGTGANYAIQMSVDSVIIINKGKYTVAPKVVAGSSFQCGNSGTARTVTINGDVTFKNGSTMISGGGSTARFPTLIIGGNLITESPISFLGVYPASTSYTTVSFTKAGTANISGADSCTFINLSVGASTILEITSNNNYIGSASTLGAVTIAPGGSLVIPSGKHITINGVKINGPITITESVTKTPNIARLTNGTIYSTKGNINVTLATAAKGTITVYNLLGKVINRKPITGTTTILDGNYKKGAYIVKVQANNNVITQKITIK